MAVTHGTVWSCHTVCSDNQDPVQVAEVLFTISGTYAQANGSDLAAVNTAIRDSRRNGKTVTVLDAVGKQQARKTSNAALMMGIKSDSAITVAAGTIAFKLSESATAGVVDTLTELADGAIPAHECPFSLLVQFTEA